MHRASDCGSHRVHGDVHARLFIIKSDEYNAAADVIVAHAPVGRLTDGLAPSACMLHWHKSSAHTHIYIYVYIYIYIYIYIGPPATLLTSVAVTAERSLCVFVLMQMQKE